MKGEIYNFILHSDVGTGTSVVSKTFFIDYGYKEKQPDCPDFIVASLAEAAEIIIGEFK